MEDYETIDYEQHYKATKNHDERIAELERQVRILNNLITANKLY